jgi:hypothetical protein
MTHAMNATRLATAPKVLRIGVMQGTRMTEERVLRERAAVTVGTTERNTFTVAAADLPPTFELFSVVDGRYALNLTDAMEGQLATPDGIRKLSDLRRASASARIPLADSARGKISLGGVVFLFQFVAAPPAMPRPQLPAALRSHWVRNVDWTYNSCFAAFLAVAIGSVAYVEYAYDPIVDQELTLDDARLVRLLAMPAPVIEPAPDAVEPTTEASAAPTPNAAAPSATAHRPTPSAADRAAARDARRTADASAAADRAVAAVASALSRSSAEFAPLTGLNAAGHGSAHDALVNGGLMAGTREDLEHVNGITNATGAPGVRRGAIAMAGPPGGGRRLGEAGLVHSTGDDIGTGPEVTHTVIRYRTEPGRIETNGGEGVVDADSVARLIRGQLGGIRSCYERELRQNPTLGGRLDVNFTLGRSGRITTASTTGLSAAPNVGTCVTGRLRGLVFPVPEGGSVEFTFPFTFTPGS